MINTTKRVISLPIRQVTTCWLQAAAAHGLSLFEIGEALYRLIYYSNVTMKHTTICYPIVYYTTLYISCYNHTIHRRSTATMPRRTSRALWRRP